MNFANWCFSLVVFTYCVLTIVNAQPTTDDNSDKDETIKKLINTVDQLSARIAKLEGRHGDEPRRKISSQDELRGTSYIRWGRKTCEGNATIVYKGYTAGAVWNQGGSGSNFVCLPENPQWKTYRDGTQSWTGKLAGVEYEMHNSGTYANNVFSEKNNNGNRIADNPAPCAVCYVEGRSTILMIPARIQCPDGWTMEYGGYLVSEWSANGNTKRSSYICLDEAPEITAGGVNQDQAVFYPVEVLCGTLPCSMYNSARELTCVVCSK